MPTIIYNYQVCARTLLVVQVEGRGGAGEIISVVPAPEIAEVCGLHHRLERRAT
jgi:hypothetical protein